MKKKFILFCLIAIFAFELSAKPNKQENPTKYPDKYVHGFGAQIGTDIGGAIPIPFKYIPSIFTPDPRIFPSLGAKYYFVLDKNWLLGGELTYKRVEMGASALAENMLARIPGGNEDGSDMYQYFTGQANMLMTFNMIELPLYASYVFPSKVDKIIFGGYAAWVFNSRFLNTPLEGFIGGEPDQVDLIIRPGDPIPVDQTNFSKYLAKWDAGIVLGYEREVINRLNVGLRVSLGFKDAFDVKVLEFKMLNMRGSFVLSYDLFRL